MLPYIARRLVMIILVLLGLTLITFVISNVVPSDPARIWAGLEAGPEQIAKARKELGLDQPLWVRYWRYLTNLLQGNMGRSIVSHRPVSDDLARYLPATLELVFVSLLVVIVLAIPLGVLSAAEGGSRLDLLTRLISYLGAGAPIFWLGLVLQIVFFARLNWLPSGGRLPLGITPPNKVTGFYTIDSLLQGDLALFAASVEHLLLPVISLSFGRVAVLSRIARQGVLQELSKDYVRTAKSKGLPYRQVLRVHVLKNAMIPIITMLGLQFGWMLGGTILVEIIFSWPGIGLYAVEGIVYNNFPPIMGVTLIIGLGFVIANFIVDLLYKVLDPRIAY